MGGNQSEFQSFNASSTFGPAFGLNTTAGAQFSMTRPVITACSFTISDITFIPEMSLPSQVNGDVTTYKVCC